MTPERVATLVARWVRLYTRDVPVDVAQRRIAEIDADLYDQILVGRSDGTEDRRIAFSILSRMARGLSADISWRAEHARPTNRRPTRGGSMSPHIAYRAGIAIAIATFVFLAWSVAAMGLVGAEGDRFDLLYLGLVAMGLLGSVLVGFRAPGMVRVLGGMAVAQAVITLLALVLGKQDSPVSSIAEIVGLNAMFIALFLAAAWLLQRATRHRGRTANAGS